MQAARALLNSILGSLNLWKIALAAVTVAVAWVSGYKTAYERAEQAANERHFAEVDAKNEQLREFSEMVGEAVLERDKALREVESLRTDARVLADRLRRSRSAGSAKPAESVCRRQLRECRDLLAEGVELSGEGAGLVGRLGADRKAVEKLTR